MTFAATGGGGSVGGGSVAGATVTTGDDGRAAVGAWTLGTDAGANALAATHGTLVATFAAIGTPGVAYTLARISTSPASAQVGAAVEPRPAVRVQDAHGNAIAGAAVSFSVELGGGSATGTSVVANGAGEATVG